MWCLLTRIEWNEGGLYDCIFTHLLSDLFILYKILYVLFLSIYFYLF
jgi:hypothetical protein